MFIIREKSYHNSQLESEVAHRLYLTRDVRQRVSRRDFASFYTLLLCHDEDEEDFFNHDHMTQETVIEYTEENMLKFISAGDTKACLLAIEAFEHEVGNEDLTKFEIENILAFNERLQRVEDMLLHNGSALYSLLVSPTGHLGDNDFELNVELDFYLNKDDPAIEKDDGNIIASIHLKDLLNSRHGQDKGYQGIADDRGDSSLGELSIHPVFKVKLCYLFHELINHHDVPLRYIPRIGNIGVAYVVRQWGLCHENDL